MTQITVTLEVEDNTKPSDIKKILNNIKGVVKVSALKHILLPSEKKDHDSDWLDKVARLRNSVDMSEIDLSDERTRYILGERE